MPSWVRVPGWVWVPDGQHPAFPHTCSCWCPAQPSSPVLNAPAGAHGGTDPGLCQAQPLLPAWAARWEGLTTPRARPTRWPCQALPRRPGRACWNADLDQGSQAGGSRGSSVFALLGHSTGRLRLDWAWAERLVPCPWPEIPARTQDRSGCHQPLLGWLGAGSGVGGGQASGQSAGEAEAPPSRVQGPSATGISPGVQHRLLLGPGGGGVEAAADQAEAQSPTCRALPSWPEPALTVQAPPQGGRPQGLWGTGAAWRQ